MKHIWIDCVTPCVGVRRGAERREGERHRGRVGGIVWQEQKAKVGKRRHPLKSLEPNWPANYWHALSGRRKHNKTRIKINFIPHPPRCQTHRNKSCKLKNKNKKTRQADRGRRDQRDKSMGVEPYKAVLVRLPLSRQSLLSNTCYRLVFRFLSCLFSDSPEEK